MLFGCKHAKVMENVLTGDLVDPSAYNQSPYVSVEVTNLTAATVYISFNRFDQGGAPPSDSIPILANATRVIPMAVYNFKATAAVTVVAFRP